MPVAVVEALAQQGVKVNAGLVSTIKSSLKRAGQGKRKGRRTAPAASSGDIPFSAILQAKQMVAKLGDIEKAKQALAALAELTQ
jgi:hypothetical protein